MSFSLRFFAVVIVYNLVSLSLAIDGDASDCSILEAFRASVYNDHCGCYESNKGRICESPITLITLDCLHLPSFERVENVTEFITCL